MNKGKIWCLVISVFLLFIVIAKSINSESNIEKRELKALAIEVGLQDVKVIRLGTEGYETNYKIISSNFDSLTYDEMLIIHNELSFYSPLVEIKQYICNDDIYECDVYSRIITENGKEVYNDYENSRKYKNILADEKDRKKYADEYPFVGMDSKYVYHTILGKPDEIEYPYGYFDGICDVLTYKWESTDEHGRWYVTVIGGEVTSILGYVDGKSYQDSIANHTDRWK